MLHLSFQTRGRTANKILKKKGGGGGGGGHILGKNGSYLKRQSVLDNLLEMNVSHWPCTVPCVKSVCLTVDGEHKRAAKPTYSQ